MTALLVLLGLAAAQEHHFSHAWGEGWSVDTDGHLRVIAMDPGDLQVDAEGTTVGQGFVVDTRLRTGLGLNFRGLRLATEWDLFTGQVGGDTWDFVGVPDHRDRDAFTAYTSRGFLPRRMSIGFRSEEGLAFEAGLVPATQWGLGVFANPGTEDTLFGRVDRGDRMLRFRTSFAPFRKQGKMLPIFATVAFDQVIEDDLARYADGQRAYQVIASLLFRAPEGPTAGFFYTYRSQREPGPAPRPTQVSVLDLYAAAPFELPAGWRVRVAGEIAGIHGGTEYVLTYGDLERTRVLSGMLAGQVEIHSPEDYATLHLRGGATSATGDPDAGKLADFTADSNFNVGLVLFDQVMGGIEAGTYNLLNDPSNAGRVPNGADLLVSEGSVRRAAWFQPVAVFKPPGPVDVKLGGVAAWSTGPVAQGFYTFRAGGEPRNHLDQPTSGHWLGGEIDWAVGVGWRERQASWWFRPRFELQGGHAFLGDNLGGGVVSTVMATGRFDW